MSLTNGEAEPKWIWFDSNTWQSYDMETNNQIEDAYVNGVESVKLNCGPHFGKYQNVHRVYFNYNTNPPSFNQINILTKDIIQIKRTLTFKPRRVINEHIVIAHQIHKKTKRKNKKKSNKHSDSIIKETKITKTCNNNSLLSNIKRIQIYKHLYKSGCNKQSIDDAIKKFNAKFKSYSPILNQSIDNIANELINIMNNTNNMTTNGHNSNGHTVNGNNNNNIHHNNNSNKNKQINFKIGKWIEININNNWIAGKIIDINWSYSSPINLTIEYQDIFNKRLTKQVKLNGSDINRNKVRPIINNNNRFNFDDNNWRNNQNNNNNNNHNHNYNRFNRNNLSIHRFNFEYHKDNKKYDEKNAKHPSEYINRKCFKCKGSGKCATNIIIERERENDIENNNNNIINNNIINNNEIHNGQMQMQMTCNKCINSSGTYRKAHSLIHSKCNGLGCMKCNETGKYPLHDILCNNCKGSGIYHAINININSNINSNINGTINTNTNQILSSGSYNQCMNGYRLPQLIPFVPKRENKKLSVYGANGDMKRLYHATDRNGANDIIETGVMFGGQNGDSYNKGIYFSDSGHYIQTKAKQKGYLVIADVFTGKCTDYIDNDYTDINTMNFNKLHQMGYDSIRAYSNHIGIEYIVFNWDQVWVHVVLPVEKVNFAALK